MKNKSFLCCKNKNEKRQFINVVKGRKGHVRVSCEMSVRLVPEGKVLKNFKISQQNLVDVNFLMRCHMRPQIDFIMSWWFFSCTWNSSWISPDLTVIPNRHWIVIIISTLWYWAFICWFDQIGWYFFTVSFWPDLIFFEKIKLKIFWNFKNKNLKI